MRTEQCDPGVVDLVTQYVERLALPTEDLLLTTSRKVYAKWLGRTIPTRYGGAYCFLKREKRHAVLINLERIDTSKPRSVEIVVAEELVHMRDHLDGDFRRHSHHGHDRIAHKVSLLTGASLEEIRGVLVPVERRPPHLIYECPRCAIRVARRRRGTWSCGRCAAAFDPRLVMQLVQELPRQQG